MDRVDCLDGLRGLASLWVLLGHCCILTGFMIPLLSGPGLGVDLFMMLSGFLMVFQFEIRSRKEDWNQPRTWATFWVRRFFRLSPMYFFALFFAFTLGGQILVYRHEIDSFLHLGLQASERYADNSLINVLLHVTYLYGFFPAYGFRTALPDWSLALEMQFYAVFPFIALAGRRFGWATTAIVLGLLSLWATTAGLGALYPSNTVLPIKLHVFLAGMLLAVRQEKGLWLRLAVGAMLAGLPMEFPVHWGGCIARELMYLGFAALVHFRSIAAIGAMSRILGSRFFHWLGELSYGVYLIHLLILQPVSAMVIRAFGSSLSNAERFLVVTPIVALISYALAFVTYKVIEVPGQELGRKLVGKRPAMPRAATDADFIAAP
ncbi:acyltransferase [Novosphingobium sp. KCTC 2891]|uniref:acyltransferase family protein n=1 Tax=Novosphingobium sp. KCTC 2891 TaxID=2989730 RepID=UPI00222165A2|nr:acyltransferase [Novosphingobium sp. KCTC 2891]MCW1382688.1 acyltransferase [Novosphingobium sp. KCTC 2891]